MLDEGGIVGDWGIVGAKYNRIYRVLEFFYESHDYMNVPISNCSLHIIESVNRCLYYFLDFSSDGIIRF